MLFTGRLPWLPHSTTLHARSHARRWIQRAFPASDIAYHDNKFKRGFDLVVDIWGADHHGYIPRMMAACEAALPADVAVFASAVADWRSADQADAKIKKSGTGVPTIGLVENPDILATMSQMTDVRPALVVGFAAETEAVNENAEAKRLRKRCDWIVANSVAGSSTFGADDNTVTLIGDDLHDAWPEMTKEKVAERLAERIAALLGPGS